MRGDCEWLIHLTGELTFLLSILALNLGNYTVKSTPYLNSGVIS